METEGILTFKGRRVILRECTGQVLENLHAAHQGATNMSWVCMCVRDAPFQPMDTPESSVEPVHPFQMICIDFFAVRGMKFLVVVDRYSNYPIVYKAPSLSSSGVVTV